MSWSSNDNNSPWGKKPKGNGKGSSENLSDNSYGDDYFKGFQDKLKDMFPKNNPASVSLLIIIALAIWTLSGFYRVGTDEQGVVTRFGEGREISSRRDVYSYLFGKWQGASKR